MIGASPDVIDKEEAFQDTYRKWRALIFKADIISVIAVFIVEIVMFFSSAFSWFNLSANPSISYQIFNFTDHCQHYALDHRVYRH